MKYCYEIDSNEENIYLAIISLFAKVVNKNKENINIENKNKEKDELLI